MGQTLHDRLTGLIDDYPDPTKEYKVGPPHKARRWMLEDPSWVEDAKVLVPESLTVLSRPLPAPPTPIPTKKPALKRVKEAIRGSRKS